MKRFVPILLVGFVAVAAVIGNRASARDAGAHPVVVELFTSQGCSSCPPADELLRRIARDPQLRGRVIPLAFHVDYWNHLGWRDPFSSPEWSQRQVEYVRAMKLESAYTPQVVVNGTRQMVGSSTREVYRAIEEELRRAPAGTVSITPSAGAAIIRAQSAKADVDLIVATFENGATTNVIRGENTGKTLANDAIVRSLKRVATLDGRNAIEKQVSVRARHGVAAFLQERATKRIVAAAVAP